MYQTTFDVLFDWTNKLTYTTHPAMALIRVFVTKKLFSGGPENVINKMTEKQVTSSSLGSQTLVL
jgi:hypothetical protein